MSSRRTFVGVVLAMFALVPTAMGQLAKPVIPQSTLLCESIVGNNGDAPTSIQIDPRGFAYVSLFPSGRQVSVDISCPTHCHVCGSLSLGQDQWQEALLHDDYLYVGHRSGGVRVIDTFDPCNLLVTDFEPTHYHFKGFATYEQNGIEYLVESEHLAGGVNGGVRIFSIDGGGQLSPVGSHLDSARDGNDVIVKSFNGTPYAIQVDSGRGTISSDPGIGLNVYDLSDPTNPTPVFYLQVGILEENQHYQDLVKWNEDYAVLGAGLDGLMTIKITDPTALSVAGSKAMPGQIRELARFNVALLLVTTTINQKSSTALVEMCDPPNPEIVFWPNLQGMNVTDAVFYEGLTYMVGVNAAGDPILQIWR